MRLIFMGTPDFAVPTLNALVDAGHDVVAVYSQPPRPANRGKKLTPSAVHARADELGLEVRTPVSLKGAEEQAVFAALNADAAIVAAYGLLLPQPILDAPKYGCLNVHGSLLPRWRGAAPIHRAIEAGDVETGVTIMQMDAGLDTGDMLFMHTMPIEPTDTTATLHDRMANLGGKLIVLALDQAAAGRLKPIRQPAEGVTYAHKIEKHEAAINWSLDAHTIVRRIRAFNPFPVATAVLHGEVIKVWSAQAAQVRPEDLAGDPGASTAPGTILAVAPEGIAVAAMNSVAILTELQRPGGKRLAVADFLRGYSLQAGQVLA